LANVEGDTTDMHLRLVQSDARECFGEPSRESVSRDLKALSSRVIDGMPNLGVLLDRLAVLVEREKI